MELEAVGAEVAEWGHGGCQCWYRDEAQRCEGRARCEARPRFPRRLDPGHGAGALRDPPLRRGRHDHARRHRHGALAADDARGAGRRRRRGRHPRQAARRARAPAARERRDDRVPAGGGHRADRLRPLQLAPQRLQRRGLPAAPGHRRAAALDRPRGAAGDGRPGRQVGVPRRVAAGAHRDPRPLRGGEAGDGRHRLVPALREGDRARRGRARARGDHSGARPH